MSKKLKKRLNLRNLGFKSTSSRTSKSSSALQPGDIVYFTYPKESETDFYNYNKLKDRLSLIVSNKRTGPSGSVFISTRNNKLLSCFDISDTSGEVVSIIISQLYKKRRKCSYKIIARLKSILGAETYRTFNTKKISKLYEIYLTNQ
jgi:hypothetical protein